MAFDEAADLIGSCEATLDTLGLLVGDMSEEVQETDDAWTIAEIRSSMLLKKLDTDARIGCGTTSMYMLIAGRRTAVSTAS